MDVIKKTITNRNLLNKFLFFKIKLLSTIKNIGTMTDIECVDNLNYNIDDYIINGGKIIGGVDSRLGELKTYDNSHPYIENFDINKSSYIDYKNSIINGVDRVLKTNDDEITYTFNAKIDDKIGTSGQTSGLLYTDNPKIGINIPKELNSLVTTRLEYMSEGWNNLNISLNPKIQEEYLLEIINKPEVKNDVFIDRGGFSILDKHFRLGEINNLAQLLEYGNGFYNINRN